jgi:parallel beta-helix repeat protein
MCRRLRDIGLVGISLAIAGVLCGCSVDHQRRPKTGALLPAPWSTYGLGLIYYVATIGSDVNPGTDALPFRTIAHGASLLTPGATLYVMSGTYAESLIDNIPGGTSWSHPVTVAAYPGHTVTLKPSTGAEWVLHFQGPQQYIVVDGLILDATNVVYDAVKITAGGGAGPAHHIRLIRCEVKNAPGQGVLITQFADLNEFINVNVHDNGTTRLDHGFYISTSHNLVEKSAVHHNSGYGVHIYNGYAGQRANNNTVQNSKIFGNGWVDGGAGIILGSGDGNAVYNNLVWGNAAGIKVAYVSPSNTAVYNNTVYANSTYGIYVYGDSSNAIIRNNLFYANGLPEVQDNGVGSLFDHNLVGTDPQFVNAAAGDFHLQPGSPAIDGGISIEAVTTDQDGTRRPQGVNYDIGAFEFVDPSP